MLLQEEIDKEIQVDGKISILTPTGYSPVRTMYRTIPLQVWELKTQTKTLRASGSHLVKSPDGFHEVYTLLPGEIVVTDVGCEEVRHCIPLGVEEVLYDFSLEDEDHVFFSSGILSHNSTSIAGRSLIESYMIPKFSSLYVAPYPDQVQTYAKKYLEMEKAFKFDLGKQNVYSKMYKNGSTVKLMNVLTSAEKTRGGTHDGLYVDEAQNFDRELLEPIQMVQTTSEMPSTIFSGTSLTTDTLLEAKWLESSMGTWFIKSPDGMHWIDTGDKAILRRMCEGEHGPICPYSGKLVDVRRGEYVHHNLQALKEGRVGMHIPQMIIPDIVYHPIRWQRIWRAAQRVSDNKLCQEYFGIAVEEGTREISEKDLQRLCVISEDIPMLREKVRCKFYKFVASGCDWGGSDYNQATRTKLSYTVHCIVGVTADGVVDILHFRRYSGMMYREIIADILKDHMEWGATMMASDFGVGAAYNMLLRESLHVDSHFIFNFTGPKTAPVATPREAHFRNQYSVNRTELLSQIFMDINNVMKPTIRCRSWDLMSPYLTDFLNVYRQPTEQSSGNKEFKYISSGTKANDSLMAFAFVYTLVRLWKGEPLVFDPDTAAEIKDLLRSPATLMGTGGAIDPGSILDPSIFHPIRMGRDPYNMEEDDLDWGDI